MRFGFFIAVSALVLNSATGFAAESGPDLTRADLEVLAANQNLIKGDLILFPTDKNACENIKAALNYMEFEYPVFIKTPSPSEFRYQVNKDDYLKIQEVSLEGVSLKDLYVFFGETGQKRWVSGSEVFLILEPKKEKNSHYQEATQSGTYPFYKRERVYFISTRLEIHGRKTQEGNLWAVNLFENGNLRKEVKLDGKSTLRFRGTDDEEWLDYSQERWWYSQIRFNLTQAPIKKHLTESGKVMYYIQGKVR